MSVKKALILIPDGVGLRNFVFSKIPKLLKQKDIELTYWNATPFDFSEADLNEIKLKGKSHPKSDLYKRARKIIEIKQSISRTGNLNYGSYLFKPAAKTFKQKLKNGIETFFVKKYNSTLEGLRVKIKETEAQTSYYKSCLTQLRIEQPDVLVVSNQRPINAVAPVEAARHLGIPTVSFIFSWDNIPKATMVVETDFYMVWSELMKDQLLEYYPYIKDSQISIVGTPQFEIHFMENFKLSRHEYFKTYDLDTDKDYICFSGDDVTTSPHDQIYLQDVAQAVRDLNNNKTLDKPLGIIFRPCPVDFSARFDKVLSEFKEEITVIRPAWKKYEGSWNSIMPSIEDQVLLTSTVAHTKFVVNVGSSMVFDYASQHKPCLFINYNPKGVELKKDIHKIYKYIHFESMPNKNAVIWLSTKEEIADKLLEGLNNPSSYVENAQKWFEIINHHSPEKASERIVEAIEEISKKP
jgi:hypothetical protein